MFILPTLQALRSEDAIKALNEYIKEQKELTRQKPSNKVIAYYSRIPSHWVP